MKRYKIVLCMVVALLLLIAIALMTRGKGNCFNLKSCYYTADVAYKKGNYSKAAGFYTRGLLYTKRIDIETIYYRLFYVITYNRGIASYTKAIQQNPKDDLAYNMRALVYYRKGYYDKAIEDLSKAIQIKPNSPGAYGFLGVVYYYKGDYAHSIENCTKAIQLAPKFADAYKMRGNAYGVKGDYERAIEDYNSVMKFGTSGEQRKQAREMRDVMKKQLRNQKK